MTDKDQESATAKPIVRRFKKRINWLKRRQLGLGASEVARAATCVSESLAWLSLVSRQGDREARKPPL
jgi:hypothetical protein